MIVSATVRPVTAARSQPNISSAARLNSTMRPSASMVITASRAVSRMAALRASLARSSISHCARSGSSASPSGMAGWPGMRTLDSMKAAIRSRASPRRIRNFTPLCQRPSTSPASRTTCPSTRSSCRWPGSVKLRSILLPTSRRAGVSSRMPWTLMLRVRPSSGAASGVARDHVARRTGIRASRRRGTFSSSSRRASHSWGCTMPAKTTLAPARRNDSSSASDGERLRTAMAEGRVRLSCRSRPTSAAAPRGSKPSTTMRLGPVRRAISTAASASAAEKRSTEGRHRTVFPNSGPRSTGLTTSNLAIRGFARV